jgi:NAD(P)H dehydrogenase (quinone)
MAFIAIKRFLTSGIEVSPMDSVQGKRLLIFYHSEGARVVFMANQIGESVRERGIEVDVRMVEEIDVESLVGYDGIVVGSPTYFSNVSWQIKKIIDETYPLRQGRFRLKGKIGGAFTSSDTKRDAIECIRLIELSLGLHHQMETIPGIIVTRPDSEAEVFERCRAYGNLIADKILGVE